LRINLTGSLDANVGASCRWYPTGDCSRARGTFCHEQLLTGADDIALTICRAPEIRTYQNRERSLRPWAFLLLPAGDC
jgi:hypothetical protein